MGVDVQKKGMYYVIRGRGYNSESWLLEHDYIAGDSTHDVIYDVLWMIIHQPIGDRMVDTVFIDSGYKPQSDDYIRPDHAVYSFSRRNQNLIFPPSP